MEDKEHKRLRAIVDTNREKRTAAQVMYDWLYGRRDEILSAPNYTKQDFWCLSCKRDFTTVGCKEIRAPQNSVWFAFYAGFCPCGKRAIRRITDKLADPYFTYSDKIRREQGMFHDDMIPPSHPRFRQLYPLQYSRLFLKEKGLIV